MTTFSWSWRRLAVLSCLSAALVALAACESSRQLPWKQAETEPAVLDKPAAAAPAAPETAGQALAPVPARPGAEAAPPLYGSEETAPFEPWAVPGGQAPGAAPPFGYQRPRAIQRVALLLPLTGPHAELGKGFLNAAQLALFDFADERFELVVHDTRATAEDAAEAARSALADGARLIIGPLLSSSVRAVTPITRSAGIPVLAFSSDRAVAEPGVYTMGFFPEADVARVVRFARARGILRFAALAPGNDTGAKLIAALRRTVAEVGGQVTAVETYNPQTTDFAPIVRRLADFDSRRQALLAQRAELEARGDEVSLRALKRLEGLETLGAPPFEALLLGDGGKRLQAVAAHLPFFDIDPARVRMLGTGQWDEPGVGAEPALQGGWFAAPSPKLRATFVAQYRETYGEAPPRLATLAYDAVALAAVLAGPQGGGFEREALTAPNGFLGRDGVFRLRPDGEVERSLAVLEARRDGFKVIDPAPESFVAPAF